MKQTARVRRIGRCAIACALVLRLFSMDLPGAVEQIPLFQRLEAFWISLETGQNVRFSPSYGDFFPDFVESPPPDALGSVLPVFSGQEEVSLFYAVRKTPDIAALLARPLVWDLTQELPTVLILHTHSTESYTKQAEDYEETSSWRTLDEGFNMLSIGETVARYLEEAGIGVLRDRELYDYPSYSGSYVRSRAALKQYLQEYPSIQLVLDLHRDASGEGGRQMRTSAEVEGTPSAQLMVVLGTNHSRYEENLSLGLKLHAQLERQSPGITRPLQLRAQRFNQDLCSGALLIEVGAAGNSHPEARVAAGELARAIVALARGTESAQG